MNLAPVDYSLRYVSPSRSVFESMKILVAGDARGTVEFLRAHFSQKMCDVETAYTSAEIQQKLSKKTFDVLICGFLTSEDYALRIVEIIRRSCDVRMLFLTGKRDAEFNTKALNLGVDDCLTSPASFFELDARVLRLCHRNTKLRFRETKILLGQKNNILEIDLSHQTVKKDGRGISLTRTEYRLLLHLALHVGRLVSKSDLEKILLQTSPLLTCEFSKHSLATHMSNLRKKLKADLFIKTISCYGFVLEA